MQNLICLFIVIAGFAAAGYATKAMHAEANENFSLVSAPPLAELPPGLLKIITLGHKGLYDDFANIWALQFLSDPRLKDQDPKQVFATLMTIAKHEIKIESFYMLSCFVMALELNHPDYCERLSLAGTNALPTSWRIPFTQGFILASMMGEPVKAAAFLKIASSRPKAPKHINRRVKQLMRGQNLSRQQLQDALEALIPEDSKMGALLLEKNLQTRPHPDYTRSQKR